MKTTEIEKYSTMTGGTPFSKHSNDDAQSTNVNKNQTGVTVSDERVSFTPANRTSSSTSSTSLNVRSLPPFVQPEPECFTQLKRGSGRVKINVTKRSPHLPDSISSPVCCYLSSKEDYTSLLCAQERSRLEDSFSALFRGGTTTGTA